MVELRPYQKEAVRFFAKKRAGIYGDAPGTGKTLGALGIIAKWNPEKTLVVTPYLGGAGPAHWRDELRRHGFDGWLKVTHYEQLRLHPDEFLDYDCVVADEAHRLKNRKAQQTKAFKDLAKRAHHTLLVTGTPVLNRADELWSLLNILSPRVYRSYWSWVHTHCEVDQVTFRNARYPTNVVKGLRPGADKAIRRELHDVLLQRPLAHCLPDMPPEPTVTVLPVALSPAERKLYDQMERYFFVETENNMTVAPNALAQFTFQRQLTSDWSKVADQNEPGTKVKATAELVRDLMPEQVVVLAAYRNTVQALNKLIPNSTTYTGGMSDRDKNLRAFQNGDRSVLCGTIDALGEGVDGLQCARHLVLVDRPWSPHQVDQAVARLYRSGQEAEVNVYHVTAAGTTDEKIATLLKDKRELVDALTPA